MSFHGVSFLPSLAETIYQLFYNITLSQFTFFYSAFNFSLYLFSFLFHFITPSNFFIYLFFSSFHSVCFFFLFDTHASYFPLLSAEICQSEMRSIIRMIFSFLCFTTSTTKFYINVTVFLCNIYKRTLLLYIGKVLVKMAVCTLFPFYFFNYETDIELRWQNWNSKKKKIAKREKNKE